MSQASSKAKRRVGYARPYQLFALERVPEHKKQEGRKGDCTGQGQNPGKTYAAQSSHLHARAVCGHGASNARGKHVGGADRQAEASAAPMVAMAVISAAAPCA